MIRAVKLFSKCERGNIAILTAGMALPLITLVAGGIDFAELSRTKANVQVSSDAAVLAAFRSLRKGWGAQQDTAKAYFEANLSSKKRLVYVKTRLHRKIVQKNIIFTYTVKTKINSFFGNLSPIGDGTITVKSTAVYNIKTRRPPRLVPNDFTGKRKGGYSESS